MENMTVRNVNKEAKRKAIFVLKTEGKTLSDAVREMIDKKANEFEQIIKR